MIEKKASGQFFIRKFGEAPDHSGRKLIGFVGLLAVDADVAEYLPDERQVTVANFTRMLLEPVSTAVFPLFVFLEDPIDVEKKYDYLTRGMGLGDLLTRPIWRF